MGKRQKELKDRIRELQAQALAAAVQVGAAEERLERAEAARDKALRLHEERVAEARREVGSAVADVVAVAGREVTANLLGVEDKELRRLEGLARLEAESEKPKRPRGQGAEGSAGVSPSARS